MRQKLQDILKDLSVDESGDIEYETFKTAIVRFRLSIHRDFRPILAELREAKLIQLNRGKTLKIKVLKRG